MHPLTRLTSRIWRTTLVHAVCVLALLAMVGRAAAQPAETVAELESRIDRLIQQLNDDRIEAREEATTALIKIGPAAATKLTAATKDTAPERSKRASIILRVFARAEAGLRSIGEISHEGLMGAVTVVLSPDGKFVYVPGHIAASINVFRRDAETGQLEHQQSVVDKVGLEGVVSLHLSSDGKYAVAAACRAKSIALYRRDKTTGELTLTSMRRREPGGELANLEWPIGAFFSPDDKFIYAIDDRKGMVLVFKVVGSEDRLALVEIFEGQDQCFTGSRGISVHPDGKTLYVSNNRAGTLIVLNRDPETGKVSVRQILRDEEDGVHGLAGTMQTCVSRDGKFVYTVSGRFEGDDAVGVFQVGSDGKLTVLQEFINGQSDLKNFSGGAVGIAISPDGTRLYAAGTKSCSLASFVRDPVSGKLTYHTTLQSLETGVGSDLGANGIGISADGKFLYLALENGGAISVFERTVPKLKP